jgi:hypothetical protein
MFSIQSISMGNELSGEISKEDLIEIKKNNYFSNKKIKK